MLKLKDRGKKQILYKISIAVLLALTLIITLSSAKSYKWGLKEEDVSSTDIYAPFNFFYVDEQSTLKLKAEQTAKVKPVYDFNPVGYEEVFKKVNGFCKRVVQFSEDITSDETTGLSISNIRPALNSESAEGVYGKIKELIKVVMDKKIFGEVDKKIGVITVRNTLTNTETEQDIKDILTLKDAKREVAYESEGIFGDNRRLRLEIIALIRNFIKPNVSYNREETAGRRALTGDNVGPVMKRVKENELILAKGEIITSKQIAQLDALAKKQAQTRLLSVNLGVSLLVVIFIILISVCIRRYMAKIYKNNQSLILVSLIPFLMVVIAKFINLSQLSGYLIPVSAGSMLTALLLEPRLAVVVAGVLAIFAGIISGNSLSVAIVAFVGGIVGVYFIIGARRRSQLIKTGSIVGVVNFICIIGLGLLNKVEPQVFITNGSWGFGSGMASAVIVGIFLPIFEYLFKVTTNISLLELSDLNHPLLKEMAAQAPGTYHHSLIVGNLAEAASESIGANSLLARVASYYHDIGKIEKSEYFSENQFPRGESKHDKLTPSMSNLIILNHVKNGIELAEKYKLSREIINVIKEHHGTSQVFYFYKKALEKIENEEELEDMSFRYPGPKPQTRESAIVLLADSIEAASRSLSDPTPGSIEGMVQKIINNKFIDGQLEECELVLKDIHKIADSFTRVLMGIFHTRVEYPEKEEKSKKAKLNADKYKKSTKNSQNKNTGPEKNSGRNIKD
ncbi:MAG: HDIG domain-containing protein [Candidatus Omnitrophota bacterium]|nr:HDIG domain-containing protein [Candidatus Omnitrophota bacterium]